jgi:hypothetical protein
MIFGLQPIAGALDLAQNTALLLFFLKRRRRLIEGSQVSGLRRNIKIRCP